MSDVLNIIRKMTDIIDNNIDRNILIQARTFLNVVCLNVVKLSIDEEKKTMIKFFAEQTFYKNYIDSVQLKFFLYKITSYKLKKFEESKLNQMEDNQRKVYQTAKKVTKSFLENTMNHTINQYNKYIEVAKKAVVKLQSVFRGKLTRLIFKLEKMNKLINEENEKAVERNRKKSLNIKK